MQRIAILDSDLRFAARLSSYFNQKQNHFMEAFPFSRAERLEDYLKQHALQGLLVSEELSEQCSGFAAAVPQLILLTKENGRRSALYAGDHIKRLLPCLYRYQPADELVRAVRMILEAKPGPDGSGAVKIGICSPLGRCGKTSLAIALGFVLARKERVLYLNMETCHGFPGRGVSPQAPLDFADLLYHFRAVMNDTPVIPGNTETEYSVPVKEDVPHLPPDHEDVLSLDRFVSRWEDLDYIMPGRSASYVTEIAGGEWLQFLRFLDRYAGYETVILDISPVIKDLFLLLSDCRDVLVPCLEDAVSRAKLAQFFEEAEAAGGISLREKMHRVLVPETDCAAASFPWLLSGGEMARFAKQLYT